MASIRSFRGLRYSTSAGNLSSLIAPPYDVLSPKDREALAEQSPNNIVHLTLPPESSEDRSKFVKYARSAATLSNWVRSGVLTAEDRPAFYRYQQRFSLDGSEEIHTRTTLIALLKLEPYSAGIVLPHEQTFPKHKEDRLRLLEATRAHLECIFGLFEDPDGEIHRSIVSAPSEVTVAAEDGVSHEISVIQSPETVQALTEMLAPKKVWIADGHHRYETALGFRDTKRSKTDDLAPLAEDYILIALGSISDPGLCLLPTHRIVTIPNETEESALAKLARFGAIQSAELSALEALAESTDRGQFGLVFPSGKGYLLTISNEFHLAEGAESEALRGLDVSILHSILLGEGLGVKGLDKVQYSRNFGEAIELASSPERIGFIMAPPSVDDMRHVSEAGEKMPQKSTFYYPKIASGLVLWSLNDF